MYTMKQKSPITALAFSSDLPLMMSGDSTGKILLWDYENGKIVYRLEQALTKKIDSIYFVPGYPLVVCTSSQSN